MAKQQTNNSDAQPMKTWEDLPELGIETKSSLRRLFNSSYYQRQLRRSLVSDDPLVDYLLTANLELLDPHPLFSTRFYLSNSLDVGYSGTNPLVHFVQFGSERRPFHPLFDIPFYVSQGIADDVENLLIHYLDRGRQEGLRPTEFFDTDYYCRTNSELELDPDQALLHFVTVGYREGRNPHPAFDLTFYLRTHPELDSNVDNALAHFVVCPEKQRDPPNAYFDYRKYISVSPDVIAAKICPMRHYVTRGFAEGRIDSTSTSEVEDIWGSSDPGERSVPTRDDLRPLIILGMHRSGTSMLVQLLERLGVDTGTPDSQIPANQWNERGYFEMKAVTGLNEQLLNARQCAWNDPIHFRPEQLDDRLIRRAQRQLLEILDQEFTSKAACIKDPRFSLTWPVYSQVLPQARLLFVIREPLACSQSLVRRDRMPLTLAASLWEYYNLTGLKNTQDNDRLIVSYEGLLEGRPDTIESVAAFAGQKNANDAISGVLEKSLNHAEMTTEELPYPEATALMDQLKQAMGSCSSPDPLPLSQVASDTLHLQHAYCRQATRANVLDAGVANRDWLDRRLHRLQVELLNALGEKN